MYSTQIRPVTDLRNKYSEVEADLMNGPVMLTKNGYGASVLVSIKMFDRLMAKQVIYEAISTSETLSPSLYKRSLALLTACWFQSAPQFATALFACASE